MKQKAILSFISSVLFLFSIFFHGQDCVAEAVPSGFKYIATDNYGSTWYLNTLSYKYYTYSEYGKIINFDIMTETLYPYKKEIIDWLSQLLKSKSKANNIYTQTSRMSHHCIYSVENHKCCIKHIYFYNAKHEIIYSHSLNVIWHPIVKDTPADIAINWITSAMGAEQINREKMQAKEISDVVGMSFLIGVIVLLLVMSFYNKLSPGNSRTVVSKHNGVNRYESKEEYAKIHKEKTDENFDYPYEDIGDALK